MLCSSLAGTSSSLLSCTGDIDAEATGPSTISLFLLSFPFSCSFALPSSDEFGSESRYFAESPARTNSDELVLSNEEPRHTYLWPGRLDVKYISTVV